eukprot:13566964-Alexandrium_andersonii.AAC.1
MRHGDVQAGSGWPSELQTATSLKSDMTRAMQVGGADGRQRMDGSTMPAGFQPLSRDCLYP